MTGRESKKFQVGDKVVCITDTPSIPEGWIGYVTAKYSPDYEYVCHKVGYENEIELFREYELELLSISQTSIARPILEERKVGKVRMDLFNEGFPNAVLEIAKVMTWANENKGYKDHDWKELPNADKDIPAAASRHGIKQLIQKAKGVPAIERTDEESNIVHLAHQAFNILAELELVLTGKIK